MSISSMTRLGLACTAFAALVAGCAKPNPVEEAQNNPPDAVKRQVTVKLDLARISVLGRSMAMVPTRLLLQFKSDTSVFRDTVAISGSGIFTKTYTLPFAAETLGVEGRDQRDSVLYRGSSTFSVKDTSTTVVSMTLSPRYSSIAMHLPGLDSMTRVVLGVDGKTWFDSAGGFPSKAGAIDLSRDYLPASAAGVDHRFTLEVRGLYNGVDTILYRLDTTVAIVSGIDTVRTLPLRWVGPPRTGKVALALVLGSVGQVEFRFLYDTTESDTDTVSSAQPFPARRSPALDDGFCRRSGSDSPPVARHPSSSIRSRA